MTNPLTAREREVLSLAAQGLCNKEIARAMVVTEQSVKNKLTGIYAKIGVSDRTYAVVVAITRGWIDAGGGDG